jgi:hypothetical protein
VSKLNNIKKLSTLFILIGLLASCGTRSISNSSYSADSDQGYQQRNDPFYKGELSELDVLGIDLKSDISEEDIANATNTKPHIVVKKGSSIMLIQSGAMIPDDDMVKGMEKYYNVSVFTGVPSSGSATGGMYSRALRLAAAKGGAENLIVYWGVLETGRRDLATKAISWVPFVGGAISDESQLMRIRMKVAVVDVKTGKWEMFSPEQFENSSTSADYTRASSDQAQVAILKSKAYKAAVEDIAKRYAK